MSDKDKTYDKERIIAESRGFLGVPSHVAAGALIDAPKKLSVQEAKDLVRTWLGREV